MKYKYIKRNFKLNVPAGFSSMNSTISNPITSKYTKKLIKLTGTPSNLIGFFSLSGNSMSIIYWVIEEDRDMASQTFIGQNKGIFYTNPYPIKSFYYNLVDTWLLMVPSFIATCSVSKFGAR